MTVVEYELQAKADKPSSRMPAIGLAVAGSAVAIASVLSYILGHSPAAADFMQAGWPFVNLTLSIGVVIILISIARMHAFLALILAAISAGFISAVGTLPSEPKESHWIAAVELTAMEFGKLAGGIGIIIALAAIIGMCILESGAADRIVLRFLSLFGEKRAGLALLLATYVISIPIFFDTLFMLLVPVALALYRRTGRDYLLYLMAICCAAGITHSVVIPHPGPAGAASEMKIDPGITIILGLAIGIVPLACGWAAMHWVNRRMPVSPASADHTNAYLDGEGKELPSLFFSLLPILLPVILIGIASTARELGSSWPPSVRAWAMFWGNRNLALLVGAAIAIALLMHQRRLGLGEVAERIGKPLETAGVIILITCAGGAFGAMLKNAGIGKAIDLAIADRNVNLLWLAYFISVAIRIAQGSVTAAILTAAAIMSPMLGPGLPCHPVYVFLAIGFGGLFLSWMNDSGFWVISRLGGLTEKQTLGSWSILTVVVSVSGMLTTWVMSMLLPLR